MKVKDIVCALERIAPPVYQEDYDNAGLLTGSHDQEIHAILLCLDCTEEVVEEAVSKGCDMIISHHPFIFKGLKKVNGKTATERILIRCISQGIAVYAAHTNLDNVLQRGVNSKLADRIGLGSLRVLKPLSSGLSKLIVYTPPEALEKVKDSLFASGAGEIGSYAECSFAVLGKGSFKPGAGAKPYSGQIGKREETDEFRLEVLIPSYRAREVLNAVRSVHPYEEMAYEIIPLGNENKEIGSGAVGLLEVPMEAGEFLAHLRERLDLKVIRHTLYTGKISKVAVCGGSGSFLLQAAIASGAQAFVTADVKYHDFFDAGPGLMYCDVGHFESEISTRELFYEVIRENFPNFAVIFCETSTNPVNYYYI